MINRIDEYVGIYINNKLLGSNLLIKGNYSKDNNYIESHLLEKGNYLITWVFYKGSKRNEKNVFNLNTLIISGSNLGGSDRCNECPIVIYYFIQGYIVNIYNNTCVQCPKGYTSNNESKY